MKYDEPPVRWRTIAFVPVLLALIAGTVLFNPFSSGAKNKMSTPTITCGGSTQDSINVIVTAGPTGAPAGFSLQWMTADDYAANGYQWFDSSDERLCKGSFSGNANLSRYELGPNESISVNVGEFLFDNGASTNCSGELVCGTDYVFRAFAHASNSLNRSDFSPDHTCSTLECDIDPAGCTYTQGYWKTHGPVPVGNNNYVWPASVQSGGMTLGTVNYTAAQLLAIFNTPAAGNGAISLAHQLIAAKLNIANGTPAPAVVTNAIAAADGLIGGLVIPPVGAGSLPSSSTSGLTGTLASYNEGAIGPGHCN
jgi:hypothetical protein